MDAYLEIAAKVLDAARRPLSPRAILDTAYKRAFVPSHLHGRTQHKTLQARISEDIVERRDHSLFYRTQPGRFFLRKFLTDESLPEEFRVVFPTRRRLRELVRGPALAVDHSFLAAVARQDALIEPTKILSGARTSHFHYGDPRKKNDALIFLRTFVCVYKGHNVLSYRVGRYRDDRDTFMSRRSIGFSTFVNVEDQTLFNLNSFGIVDAGVRATKIDLDIPDTPTQSEINARLCCFIWSTKGTLSTDLLAVVDFECPNWFEPTKRRLALNDLCWLDTSKAVNDIDDFDPWSKIVLLARYMSDSSQSARLDAHNSSAGNSRRRLSKVSN